MYVILYIFLALTTFGNIIRLATINSNQSLSSGARFLGFMWYVFSIMCGIVLITLFACR